jgi:4-amino-4-deoxychorismate lyase
MSTTVYIQDSSDITVQGVERLFLGEGLFETLKVHDQQACYTQQHWERLSASASALNIPFNVSLTHCIDLINEAIRHANIVEGGIKLILTSADAPRGLANKANESKFIIIPFECSPSKKPLKLMGSKWRRDPNNPIYQYKSINYLECIQAQRIAKSRGLDDVLFFNTHQHATETTMANIFVIKNDQLITPPETCGLLPGIIRQRAIIIAERLGIELLQKQINHQFIASSDALFLTNSLKLIQPVSELDGQVFNTTHPMINTFHAALVEEKGLANN